MGKRDTRFLLLTLATAMLASMVGKAGESLNDYAVLTDRTTLRMTSYAEGPLAMLAGTNTLAFTCAQGEFTFDTTDTGRSTFMMSVAADSIRVDGDMNRFKRSAIIAATRDDVMESEQYPEIVFRSSQVTMEKTPDGAYSTTISGVLRMHGVARPVEMHSTITLAGDTLRSTGSLAILQSDFDMTPYSFLGLFKIKDLTTISIDLTAIRSD